MTTGRRAGLRAGLAAIGSWVVAGACFGLAGACCDGSGATATIAAIDGPVPARFQPLATAVEAERVSLGAPGVAVAVVEKGRVTFAHGFGSKDPTAVDPVHATTLFRIGSNTKMLTAIALLQTVQAGHLDLDRPITDKLPGFHLTLTPTPVGEITTRQLLTHASGLHDYLELDAPADERTDAALAGFLGGRFGGIGYVQSPPGAFYAYANPGYMLAGLLAETVTGTPYRQLMHDRVLVPLGMARTFFLPSEVIADGDYANGKTCAATDDGCASGGFGPVVHPDSYDNPWARPAGYAWSSVLDLAKAAAFLVHGDARILRDDLWQAMTSAQVPMPESGGQTSYGFGVEVAPGILLAPPGRPVSYYKLKFLTHDGALAGYSANLSCLPEQDFCFVTLANGDDADFIGSLVTAISTLVDLPAPSPPPDLSPRPDRFPAYAGTYDDPFALGEVDVTARADGLSALVPSLDPTHPFELMPTAVDNFVDASGTTTATFIADPDGVYRYLYSRPFVAVRVAPP